MAKNDINKFSWAQMTSNTGGKTSASGTSGVLCVGVGLLGFLAGVVDHFAFKNDDIMTQSILLITLGAGLLGYRKSKDGNVEQTQETAAPEGEEPKQ